MDPYEVEWARPNINRNKSPDWYWILGIMAFAGIIVAFLLNNILLAVIIGLSAVVIMMLSHAEPHKTVCRLTPHHLTINDTVYPLRTMNAYHIDEKYGELVLRFTTDHFFIPLVIVHIPFEHAEQIDMMLGASVPTEYIEEGVSHKLLEIFGF